MREVLVAGVIGLGMMRGCSITPPTLKTEPTKLSSGEIRDLQMYVSKELKDPYSAVFSSKIATATYELSLNDVKLKQGTGKGTALCGYVNAKNSYGGYAGSELYSVLKDRDGSVEVNLGNVAKMNCVSFGIIP